MDRCLLAFSRKCFELIEQITEIGQRLRSNVGSGTAPAGYGTACPPDAAR